MMMMMVTTIYTENTKKMKKRNDISIATQKDDQLEMMIIPAWVRRRGANGL